MGSKPPRGKPPSQRGNRGEPERYDPDDIRYIAMHEAGHAVAAVVLGTELRGVDLKRRRLPDGRISVGFTDTGKVMVEDVAGKGEAAAMPHMIQSMAGPFAESALNKRMALDAGGADVNDRAAARSIAAAAVCDLTHRADGRLEVTSEAQEANRERLESLIHAAVAGATDFVNENLGAITNVANALIERRELTGDEVAAIVEASKSDLVETPVEAS